MIRILLCFHALLLAACHGFSAKAPKPKVGKLPKLDDLPPQLFSRKLKFRVAVGDKKNPFQMKDMVIEMESNKRVTKQSSTGIYEAGLLQNPSFINDKGEQAVALKEGGWEIRWAKDSPHGHLTCSFVTTDELRRTKEGSTMEAGRFFLNHRVWNRENLENERERRREIQNEAAKFIDDRDKKIKKIVDEDASWVVNYAKAAKSMKGYYDSGIKEALYVPLLDEQVLELAPDLFLSSRGEVFQRGRDGRPDKIGDSRVDEPTNSS